jgi:hypothetical protein
MMSLLSARISWVSLAIESAVAGAPALPTLTGVGAVCAIAPAEVRRSAETPKLPTRFRERFRMVPPQGEAFQTARCRAIVKSGTERA